MATALRQLLVTQIGIETTKGTGVAATKQLIGDLDFDEDQQFYRSPYPASLRATTGGAGVIVSKGTRFKLQTELTAEEILWPMHLGIRGGLTPTSSSGDYTWTAAPETSTGIPTIAAASLEVAQSDGTTNHLIVNSTYVMCDGFDITYALNQPAMLDVSLFGRARETAAPTAALAPYTTREALVTPLTVVSIDTSYSGLGGTAITGIIRSAKWSYKTGFAPNYSLDGRSNKDFVKHRVSAPTATLSMLLELDATAATALATYRSNALTYVRLKTTGSVAAVAARYVQVDGAYRWLSYKTQVDGDQVLVACELEAVYDATGTKMIEVKALNTLATIASA